MPTITIDRSRPPADLLRTFTDRTDLAIEQHPASTVVYSQVNTDTLTVCLLDEMHAVGPVGSTYDQAAAINTAMALLTDHNRRLLDLSALHTLLTATLIPSETWATYADTEWSTALGRILRADGTQLVSANGRRYVPALSYTRGVWYGYITPFGRSFPCFPTESGAPYSAHFTIVYSVPSTAFPEAV